RAIAIGVAENLAASLLDDALDDPNLIRAQTAKRERLHRATLGKHCEPLRGQTETEHCLTQCVCRPRQQRPHAVPSGELSAPRTHVNSRRPGCPPAAARQPRAWAPSRAA